MKKVLFILFAGLMASAHMSAVTANDVLGQYDGNLNIGGQLYPNKSIYLLPGTVANTVTFVLPDFMYNSGKLGNIVLPNIPMDANGQLTLENATLYLDSISERATITIINGLEDGGIVYNSIVTATDAQVILSIGAPSLPQAIYVLFQGTAATGRNYELPNGGMEGAWTNFEPQGWHSFYSATGLMVDFIRNDKQFIPSTDVRPGSKGKNSAMMSSDLLFGVKANGNCTNGQINAGSMTADDATANYNFSDPDSVGFNTPFNGRPDSLVFWAKYLPADRDHTNAVNKARMNTVITTAARYQDPEVADYSSVKIATASINYTATANMGWQRLSVPFEYAAANADKQPAYILTTFSTNMVPGGGSSYSTGGSLSKVNVLDSVYIDDVEIVYNKQLSLFSKGQDALTFEGHIATVADNYCDDCAKYAAAGNGLSAQAFIAFDATHKCIFIYVIADDYAQTGTYNLYRVDFADSDTSDLTPIINPEQGVENIFTSGMQVEKIIRDGQLLIRRGNSWYSLTGVRVK